MSATWICDEADVLTNILNNLAILLHLPDLQCETLKRVASSLSAELTHRIYTFAGFCSGMLVDVERIRVGPSCGRPPKEAQNTAPRGRPELCRGIKKIRPGKYGV